MLQDDGPAQTPEIPSPLLIPLPAPTERDLEAEISDMAMQGGVGGRGEEFICPGGRREDSGSGGSATEPAQQPEASGSGVQFRKPVKKDLRNIRKRSHEGD